MSAARQISVMYVAGARPNFMKVAPVMAAGEALADGQLRFRQTLVHTGQHYDPQMSDVFFRDLALPAPDFHLDVGSGSHAVQTAAVLERLEPILLAERPDLVVVVGDVNSTLAAALCAAKLTIPVAHVEAGLRSGDRSMPEELNRIVTDQLCDLLFTTEAAANDNLAREGVAGSVHFVGNTMIDSLERVRAGIDPAPVLAAHGVRPREYALVTLHRPANVDDEQQLENLLGALERVGQRLPLVWPVHVRTRERLHVAGRRLEALVSESRMILCDPLAYTEFVALMSRARVVLTDSGGVQEETTVLGVPCLTLRTTTERPVTVTQGTNRLVDPHDGDAIVGAVDDILSAPMPSAVRPELWDGHAAERIVAVIAEWAVARRAPEAM